MMANVDCDFSQFDKFVAQIEEATLPEIVRTVESRAVNKLAASYIAVAKANTPVKGVQRRQVGGKEVIADSEHMKRSWGGRTGPICCWAWVSCKGIQFCLVCVVCE